MLAPINQAWLSLLNKPIRGRDDMKQIAEHSYWNFGAVQTGSLEQGAEGFIFRNGWADGFFIKDEASAQSAWAEFVANHPAAAV
jgi:hypothetical protein